MEIILIRHGITASNQNKVYARDDEPLSEEGRIGILNKLSSYQNIDYDIIFTSPFLRAQETAELIQNGRDIPIFEEPLIKELSMGILEGHSFEEIFSTKREMIEDWMNSPYTCKPQGGESIEEGMNRAKKFLAQVDKNKKAIFVTHDAFIRLCLCVILNNPQAFFKFSIDNGSITRIITCNQFSYIHTING